MGKNINIQVFLDEKGRIIQLPIPNRTRRPVVAYLADKFAPERIYSEKQVNAIINDWHTFGDYFILRRLLIDYGFLARTPNGAEYWVIREVNEEAAHGAIQ